jgi:hypothetical protein
LRDLPAFNVGNPILQINPAILADPQSGISKQLAAKAQPGTLPTGYRSITNQ